MTHSEIWLIITQNTTHSKFPRRLLCYLRNSFLGAIFNGDLPLEFACLAEFNHFNMRLYWEWMSLSRHYTYINTKFSGTNICSIRKQTLFEVPRYAGFHCSFNYAPRKNISGESVNSKSTDESTLFMSSWILSFANDKVSLTVFETDSVNRTGRRDLEISQTPRIGAPRIEFVSLLNIYLCLKT